MKRNVSIIATAAALCSCEISYIGPMQQPPSVKGVLCSAVVYPEGYNWRRDSLGGAARCSLVLLDAGVSGTGATHSPLLSFPADEAHCAAPDMDMHRIAGTHLYTDLSTATHTIVGCDGLELFRFKGRERIEWFDVDGGDVYTLGTRRNGRGWALRRNGKVLLEQDSGRITGGLHRDGEALCLAYSIPLLSTSGQIAGWRDYLVRDSTITLIVLDPDATQLLAARSHDGATEYVAAMRSGRLLWHWKDGGALLDTFGASQVRAVGLELSGGQVICHAQILDERTQRWSDRFWRRDGLAAYTEWGRLVCSLCRDAPCLCYAHSERASLTGISLYCDGHEVTLPGNMALTSPEALCCGPDGFHAGMNDVSRDWKPVLVNEKDTVEYEFNGYFTCLRLP